MKNIKSDIDDEFTGYTRRNYTDNVSLSELYSFYDINTQRGDNRGFSFERHNNRFESDCSIARHETIKLFAEVLKDTGNLRYSIKLAKIGEQSARWYCNLLNAECERRGLPLIFVGKKKTSGLRKLNERQVSYIKYLACKYPYPKIANIYCVSVSLIQRIACGLVWGHISPVKAIEKRLRYVNQFSSVEIRTVSRTNRFYWPAIPEEEVLIERLILNRWGDKGICCPFCNTSDPYRIFHQTRYECRNCGKKFSHLVGTLYQNTKIPLTKWYQIEMVLSDGGEVTQTALALATGLTQASVHKLIRKINNHPFPSLLLF